MLKYARSDRDPCGAKAASGRRKKASSPAEALTALEREGKRMVMQRLLGSPFPPGSRLAVCSQPSVRHCTEGLTRSPLLLKRARVLGILQLVTVPCLCLCCGCFTSCVCFQVRQDGPPSQLSYRVNNLDQALCWCHRHTRNDVCFCELGVPVPVQKTFWSSLSL